MISGMSLVNIDQLRRRALGTVLLASLHAGAQMVMRPQFDPADLLDALARHGISQLQGPPALYARLLAWSLRRRWLGGGHHHGDRRQH